MNRKKALGLLNEVVTFYLEFHKETKDVEPTNDKIEKAEKYIENNLN